MQSTVTGRATSSLLCLQETLSASLRQDCLNRIDYLAQYGACPFMACRPATDEMLMMYLSRAQHIQTRWLLLPLTAKKLIVIVRADATYTIQYWCEICSASSSALKSSPLPARQGWCKQACQLHGCHLQSQHAS